jgi:BMFP domain-containing protein YqiC
MQSQNRLLDDLARVASGAFGVAAGMRSEVESRMREQFEQILSRMDLVTREDYEAAYAMAQNARDAQESMVERVATLEARVNELEEKLAAYQTSGESSGKSAGSGSKTGGAGSSTGSSKGGGKSGKSAGSKKGGGAGDDAAAGEADSENDGG